MTLITPMDTSSLGPFEITSGPCSRCGTITETFPGKRYCESCRRLLLAELESTTKLQDWRHRMNRHLHAGYISQDTFSITTKALGDNPFLDPALSWFRLGKQTTLWLWSPGPGTGKTSAARAIIKLALYESYNALEITARRVHKLSARFDEGKDLWPYACSTPLLLLDDLDKPSWTNDTSIAALWELFDSRATPHKRTIITANCSPQQFTRLLARHSTTGLAAADRLNPLTTIHRDTPSLRGNNNPPSETTHA